MNSLMKCLYFMEEGTIFLYIVFNGGLQFRKVMFFKSFCFCSFLENLTVLKWVCFVLSVIFGSEISGCNSGRYYWIWWYGCWDTAEVLHAWWEGRSRKDELCCFTCCEICKQWTPHFSGFNWSSTLFEWFFCSGWRLENTFLVLFTNICFAF